MSTLEPGPLRHGDDHALVEVTLAGTQAADWVAIPNTARSFATRLAALFDVEADHLVCERVFTDYGDIAGQAGIRDTVDAETAVWRAGRGAGRSCAVRRRSRARPAGCTAAT